MLCAIKIFLISLLLYGCQFKALILLPLLLNGGLFAWNIIGILIVLV